MARHVFFSFHYERDVRRAAQVRNAWVVRRKGTAQPFYDHAKWETAKKKNTQQWIEEQLYGASVTAVLIGAETAGSKWVHYELQRSHELKMGILGIYIHKVKDPVDGTCKKGRNPLDDLIVEHDGQEKPFSSLYRTYDWVKDDGYNNLTAWVETAAGAAGR
jgi:hypothetical protein